MIPTRHGYQTVRLPFSIFRPTNMLEEPTVDPKDVTHITMRYEPRQRMAATILGQDDEASQCVTPLPPLLLLL